MSLGRTGIMIPNPSTSSTSVTKMKPSAGFRCAGACIAPSFMGRRRLESQTGGSVQKPCHQLVGVRRDLAAGLDLEHLARPLDGCARLRLHARLGKVLRECDDDLVEEHR